MAHSVLFSYCSFVNGVTCLIIRLTLINYCGNPRKNKRGIPQKFLVTKNRPILDSMFEFLDNFKLASYIPENKNDKNEDLFTV